MVEYRYMVENSEEWIPGEGRFCPLTEEACTGNGCRNGCQGMCAAEALNNLQHGSLELMARAYQSTIGHFPVETQRAIATFINDTSHLEPFREFLSKLD